MGGNLSKKGHLPIYKAVCAHRKYIMNVGCNYLFCP